MKVNYIIMEKMKAKKLSKDKNKYIGVIAPCDYINLDNIKELEASKKIIENSGYNVKFSKNIYDNSWGFANDPKKRASDFNDFILDKSCQMIWCAKGGNDCSSTFDFIDFKSLKQNPKIICGFSDFTSLNNMIYQKSNLINFSGINFKTFSEEPYLNSLNKALDRFENDNKNYLEDANFKVLNEGIAKGEIIGGNLTLMSYLISGKYKVDFKDKILFLEELGFESNPCDINRNINYMIQNGIFDQINGLVIGNYIHESQVLLEDIIIKNLNNYYENLKIPILKTNCFGHIYDMTPIPIGTYAMIDTNELILLENTLDE